jgi:tRNA (cmo5U34)-methyltransferase
MGIKEQFDNISEKYDNQRRQLLPCFDDYYNLPLTVLDIKKETPEILDIGSGTGLFSSIVLQKYPKARFTLIDLSDKMLEFAKERFKDYKDFQYIVADYTKYNFEKKFDIIISALSIHHLPAEEKKNLYQQCYNMLNDNGIFINVDQVLSPSPEIEAMFSKLWRKSVENSLLNPDDIQKAYERVSFDNPSTLQEQLNWLINAGFKNTDIIYKYYHFCVFYAKK